jgi:methyl-accepting chemotaxis protein
MKSMSFKARLLCIVGFVWFSLLVLGALDAISTRQLLMHQRQRALAEQIDSAISVIRYYVGQAQSHAMSEQDARKAAIASIRAVRYGANGYLVIDDSKMLQLVNPVRPEGENKSNDLVDSTGRHFVAEIIQHDLDGTHLTQYLFPKPGETTPQSKLAYGDYVREWDWHVFTGAYIDDIDRTFYAIMAKALVAVVAIGLLLSLAMVYIIRKVLRSIGGDPQDVATVCARIAAGNLSEHVHVAEGDQHSLMHSMKAMQDRLIETIGQIKRVADGITAASREIADGHGDLSARTEQQAASLAETASSMEELTSTVRLNSEHASQASQLALDASTTAQGGNGIVAEVVATMDQIAGSSNKIVDIISVIEGIAFQTNILALNAAVEAARAGEQGRGFAVVAAEVRALAQRSASAAKDVKSLIDESVSNVSLGQTLAHRSGSTMQQVLSAVTRVTDIMGEISAASSQQTQGIEHVGIAITQMDSVTQQNAALVEQATAAASALAGQADELKRTVSVFRLAV